MSVILICSFTVRTAGEGLCAAFAWLSFWKTFYCQNHLASCEETKMRRRASLRTMKTGTLKFLALMGMVLTSCSRPSGQQVTEVKRPLQQLKIVPAAQSNGHAAIACGYFQKAMTEVSKGLLTNSELEQRIGSTYDHARLATLDSV